MILVIISTIPYGYTQQQQHIPWPSLADSPWPIGRGDAQATGRSKYIGPRTPNVMWRKDMPLGIYHGPIIGFNDDLFVGTRAFTGFTGDTTNLFYSLDKNGNSIWTFITYTPQANIAGPTVTDKGTIYFASTEPGGLYAINPDGTLLWNNKKFSAVGLTRFISVAKNGNLYIPWFDSLFVLKSENGNIIDTLYSFSTYNIAGNIVFSTGGDTIFYITSGSLIATKINGELLWSYSLGNNSGVPVVDNNNRTYLYGSQSGNRFLYCINPNGTVNWQFPFSNTFEYFENYSSPTIDRDGNIIFQTSTDDSGYVYSVNYYGNLNWKTTLGHYGNDGAFINHGLVCDAEGKIYCGSSLGLSTNFWCLDSDGTILWKLDLEGYEFDSSPAIGSDGTLYIGTHLSSTFQNHVRNLIAVRDTVTSVENNDNEILKYQLEQNYPNPFNSTTNIRYTITQSGDVTLKVYDLMGNKVATLLDGYHDAGSYDVIFQANNLASGIYFYQLQVGEFIATKKLILLK